MKLAVDASVVVKWFVSEVLSDEARLLLARRIHLHAPDLMLTEYANVIWKKARRKEIPHGEHFLSELPGLSDVITLIPDRELVLRASRIATDIDHPIHDCLYLACAESIGADLVTADSRLANKWVRTEVRQFQVLFLGDPDVRKYLAAKAFAPAIDRRLVEELAGAFDVLDKTESHVLDKLFTGTRRPHTVTPEDWDLIVDSPTYRRLINAIRKLSKDEHIDLIALGWLGDELFHDWPKSVEHAEEAALSNGFDPNYVAGYGHCWRKGFERMVEDSPEMETTSRKST